MAAIRFKSQSGIVEGVSKMSAVALSAKCPATDTGFSFISFPYPRTKRLQGVRHPFLAGLDSLSAFARVLGLFAQFLGLFLGFLGTPDRYRAI